MMMLYRLWSLLQDVASGSNMHAAMWMQSVHLQQYVPTAMCATQHHHPPSSSILTGSTHSFLLHTPDP
jgi:hypothetical protein